MLSKDHLHIALASFGTIATAAAMLFLFCLFTSLTQKAFQLLLSTVLGQFINVTFRYRIVNRGFGDSKIFKTNILVKLAIAYKMFWCSLHFGHKKDSARPVVFLCRCRLQCPVTTCTTLFD